MTTIAIMGARVIDPANNIDEIAHLYIKEGKIIRLSPTPSNDICVSSIIDATGYIVCPGLVDMKATLLNTSTSLSAFKKHLEQAASAGITHVATQGFTKNRCLTPIEIEHLTKLARDNGKTYVYFIGALTQDRAGDRLNELALFKEAGCIGFTNGDHMITNTLVKRRCYDYASMLGLGVYIPLEDPYLSDKGCMHEGEVSARLGLTGIPALSESLALATESLLIAETGIKAHFHAISSEKGTQLLAQTKNRLPITSDTPIHQLFLTEEDIELVNGLCRVTPPFRAQRDRLALRQAIKENLIDAICSDHIALPPCAKEVPFSDSLPGIAAWPLLLPLALRLAKEENISMSQIIDQLTHRPASLLGIDAGHLTPHSQANLLIFDPQEEWLLTSSELSKFGTNNPFKDQVMRGKVKYTMVDGCIAYRDCHVKNASTPLTHPCS